MENKIYRCPFCNTAYTNPLKMGECAQRCGEIENARLKRAADNKAIEEAKSKIADLYADLQTAITNYVNMGGQEKIVASLTYEKNPNKDSAPTKETDKNKATFSFEDFLKNNLEIHDKPKETSFINRPVVDKTSITDVDKLIKSLSPEEQKFFNAVRRLIF